LTRTEAAQAEKKLQTKLEHLEQLVDADETVAPPPPQAGTISFTQNHNYQHEETELSATCAKSKKEKSSVAPPAAAQGQRVVVIEKQVPVYIREYVPPPQAAAPTAVQDVPSLIKPYERRGAQKFSRHGALIK
jgi:hypothetical protein